MCFWLNNTLKDAKSNYRACRLYPFTLQTKARCWRSLVGFCPKRDGASKSWVYLFNGCWVKQFERHTTKMERMLLWGKRESSETGCVSNLNSFSPYLTKCQNVSVGDYRKLPGLPGQNHRLVELINMQFQTKKIHQFYEVAELVRINKNLGIDTSALTVQRASLQL